jgi:hypothetical protein
MKMEKTQKLATLVHSLSFVAHTALAIAAWLVAKDAGSLPVTVSAGRAPYAPQDIAIRTSFLLSPLYLVFAVEIVTALFELAYAVMVKYGKPVFVDAEDTRKFEYWTTNGLRWVEYSITATLVTIAQAVGTGNNSLSTFVLLIGSGVALQFTGYISEQHITNRWVTIGALVLGFFVMTAQIVALQAGAEMDDSDAAPSPPAQNGCVENTADFTKWQANLVPYFVYYLSFGVHATLHVVARLSNKLGYWKKFQFVELVYALLSVSAKITINGVVLATTRVFLEYYAPCDARAPTTLSENQWDAVQIVALALPALYTVVFVGLAVVAVRHDSTSSRKARSPFRALDD